MFKNSDMLIVILSCNLKSELFIKYHGSVPTHNSDSDVVYVRVRVNFSLKKSPSSLPSPPRGEGVQRYPIYHPT
jgi:hypothetical protein